MALALRRQYRFRKRIGQLNKQAVTPVSNALITAIVGGVGTLVITFDQPVILNGFPASYVVIGGAAAGDSPLSATLTAEDEITCVITGDATLSTGVSIPPYDPAVRTKTGGFATPDAFTI